MKSFLLMLPIAMCCFGLLLSSLNAIIGLIVSSMGLPLWLLIRWLDIEDPKKDETSKLPITSGGKGN